MAKKEVEQQFALKAIELQMVSTLQQAYFSNLSNFLSFVALERLAYKVTENTRFRIEDGNMYVKEEEPKEEEISVA